jgi:CIC family chloride channel protein
MRSAFDIMMQPMRRAGFLFLASLTGVIAGLGAVVFRLLIGLVHNVLLYGRF